MTTAPAPLRADRLLGASVWRIAFLLVQGGGSVTLAAALGHILDARAFATTSLVQGVLVIAQSIGDFGLAQATVAVLPAWIARSPDRRESLLSGAARAYMVAAAAALLLTAASALVVPAEAVVPILVSAPAAAATVLVGGADGLLRSQGEFRLPVIYVAVSELGGFVGIPAALATHSPAWTCAAISIGTTVGATGAVLALRAHLRGPSPRWLGRREPLSSRADDGGARRMLMAAVPLGGAQVFVVLGARFDTLLAASSLGLVAAGTFEGVWRIFQLGQYAAGALATAAAPFIANALGSRDGAQATRLLRQLLARLTCVGLVGGAVLYLARWPLAHLLAGSLAAPVAGGIVFLAAATAPAAAATGALYTLISLDGGRRRVLTCFAAGAAVNLALGFALRPALQIHGILIGCAAGSTVTSCLLLASLVRARAALRDRLPSEAS